MTAYLALFGWSFLAATVLPLASEPMLVALVRLRGDLAVPVLTATAGNYLGACTTYWLARRAALYASGLGQRRAPELSPGLAADAQRSGDRAVARATAAETRRPRAVVLVERFGQPALLLSWVPIIGDAIVVVAGGAGIGFAPFSAWVIAGKLGRYAAVAWIARQV